ncbi:hypothetical protein F5880DRAFT_1618216 [Lentinula raphanica]|nr:hypothetical protein F5880DRAFT_1618216 [Lentinula raphanica]
MLINLSGKPGAFSPCDIIQEYFNRLLEFIVERKGKEFDHVFIQQIISRNLHRMSQVKIDARTSVGLAHHSGRHSEPHSNSEVRILLKQYAHHELHLRRVGRYVEERDTDNFMKGWSKLDNGKLAKWVDETASARVRLDVDTRVAALDHSFPESHSDLDIPATTASDPLVDNNDCNDGDFADSDTDTETDVESDDEDDDFETTLGMAEIHDGTLHMTTLEVEDMLEEFLDEVECSQSDSGEVSIKSHHWYIHSNRCI